tara:strand:+ start:2582 stop:3688 length:1107 start_codon:yes stop_codon:yes gene_type:complete
MASFGRPARLEAVRAFGRERIDDWLRFAEDNRVAPIVAHTLIEAYGDDFAQAEEAKAIYARSERRMAVLMEELDAVAARLAKEGIGLVALKNAGIARGIFPHVGCCPMGDLDVLIDKTRFREAHRLIEETGFVLATRGTVESADLEEGLAHGGTEYRREVGGEEVWFELQWRPVAGRWIRQDQEPKAAELIARSVPIEGTDVRLLSPVDNMIQVSLHTAKHSYVRAPGLRLHTDVDRLAIFQTPDWYAVTRQAKTLEITTAVFFSLALAQTLLSTPIPAHVLEALAPNPLKREAVTALLAKADVFEPNQAKFSRPEMIALHAFLYDDFHGLLASAMDTSKSELTVRNLPQGLWRGFNRMKDILTRYQA